MADSYRLSVLKALTAHLEGISTADGYNHDLAGAVFRGVSRFGDESPDVMVSILENPRPGEGLFADDTTRAEEWPLLLQGWCPDDKIHPTDPVYGLLDDVERRLARLIVEDPRTGNPLYPAEYCLGGKITGLVLAPGVVRPPTDGLSSRSFFFLSLRVGLAADLG